MEPKAPTLSFSRKFPRRNFQSLVGLLYKGNYVIAPSIEIGEGGLLVQVGKKIEVGGLVVVNLFLPKADFVTVTAEVLYTVPSKNGVATQYGLKFRSLSFESKRHIRDYIADKTENEI